MLALSVSKWVKVFLDDLERRGFATLSLLELFSTPIDHSKITIN